MLVVFFSYCISGANANAAYLGKTLLQRAAGQKYRGDDNAAGAYFGGYRGLTALQAAAWMGKMETIELLLMHGHISTR